MTSNCDDKINFPYELLLTNRKVANLWKAFANNSSNDIKLSKTQLPKMIQSGGFLCRLLGPLLKTGLPLMKNVIKPLAKSVLIPVGLTAVASAAIHKKVLRSIKATLIISNDEIEYIIKIVKSLEDPGLLLKGVSKRIENEAKEQKGRFLNMLLGLLGLSLLGNILAGKGINRAEKGFIKAGYGYSVKNKDF